METSGSKTEGEEEGEDEIGDENLDDDGEEREHFDV